MPFSTVKENPVPPDDGYPGLRADLFRTDRAVGAVPLRYFPASQLSGKQAGQRSSAVSLGVGETWRRVPESNRSSRICNPLRNLSANPPAFEVRKA